ncbi:hypothetical protein O7599_14365 [Streptomyces sp. WMMC500]|uniref:hypothetical protein n=1 Tax=Streptomyces sp. WMMC500 TaxID=3015154 RepID=UPI00248BD2FA|nr:hypothetical protein [Streptomyces sp. WMMC500]WBB63628.1 hypothetical protein O7599_14365 [Streptomyces sp. WMMC500]
MMDGQEGGVVSGGTVRIRRERRGFWAALDAFTVWIDDVRVDRLHFGGEVIAPVSPGAHRVQVRWASAWAGYFGARESETVDFLVEPGQVIRFDCGSTTGAFHSAIQLRRLSPQPLPAPPPPSPQVFGMTETTRREERLGEDPPLLIDNSDSSSPLTRTFKASREWTQTLTWDESRSKTLGIEMDWNLWIVVKAAIEAHLERHFSIEIGSRHLFEEEFSVTVKERTAMRIVLRWKRIWQCTETHVLLPDRSVYRVPFRFVVNETFDQRSEDDG